jgi:hypothetical protein
MAFVIDYVERRVFISIGGSCGDAGEEDISFHYHECKQFDYSNSDYDDAERKRPDPESKFVWHSVRLKVSSVIDNENRLSVGTRSQILFRVSTQAMQNGRRRR